MSGKKTKEEAADGEWETTDDDDAADSRTLSIDAFAPTRIHLTFGVGGS
jgi:hypothetical protein